MSNGRDSVFGRWRRRPRAQRAFALGCSVLGLALLALLQWLAPYEFFKTDDFRPRLLPMDLTDGEGFLWDIQTDGSIGLGSDNVFSGALHLQVGGRIFPDLNEARMGGAGENLILGPARLDRLDVSRLIFVPSTDDGFARYLEILSNPTSTPITTDSG